MHLSLIHLLADSVCGPNGAACDLQNVAFSSDTLSKVMGVLFTAVGSLSVIFLVVGGLRYALSGGDAKNIKQAKETILYAIVGLAISLVAVVIISLVSTVAGGGQIK